MRNKSLLCVAAACAAAVCAAERRVWIEDVDRSAMTCGYRLPLVARSIDGGLLSVDGKVYQHGLGTHAVSQLVVPVGGNALAFEATVGIDDEKRGSEASIEFKVWADGRLVASSGILRKRRRSAHLKADLAGVQVVVLEVADAGDGISSDHADWADAFSHSRTAQAPRTRATSPSSSASSRRPSRPRRASTRPRASACAPEARPSGASP